MRTLVCSSRISRSVGGLLSVPPMPKKRGGGGGGKDGGRKKSKAPLKPSDELLEMAKRARERNRIHRLVDPRVSEATSIQLIVVLMDLLVG